MNELMSKAKMFSNLNNGKTVFLTFKYNKHNMFNAILHVYVNYWCHPQSYPKKI